MPVHRTQHMIVKITIYKTKDLEIIMIKISDKYKALFNPDYQDIFGSAWYDLCSDLYWELINTIEVRDWDLYIEDAVENLNIKLYIHPALRGIEPRLIF